MKKALQAVFVSALVLPTFAFAENAPQAKTVPVEQVIAAQGAPVVQADINNQNTVVVSPRTGVRYTLGNTGSRPVLFRAALLTPVDANNVDRIVATNPALSVESQEKAKQTLLAMPGAQQ